MSSRMPCILLAGETSLVPDFINSFPGGILGLHGGVLGFPSSVLGFPGSVLGGPRGVLGLDGGILGFPRGALTLDGSILSSFDRAFDPLDGGLDKQGFWPRFNATFA